MKKLSSAKILYVEDGIFASKVGQAVLRKISDNVYPVFSGFEALKLFHQIRPDIVITDMDMPGMSGSELVSRIRLIDKTTPIIIVSAMDGITELPLNAVPKPITVDNIKPLMAELIYGRNQADLETEKKLYQLSRNRLRYPPQVS